MMLNSYLLNGVYVVGSLVIVRIIIWLILLGAATAVNGDQSIGLDNVLLNDTVELQENI